MTELSYSWATANPPQGQPPYLGLSYLHFPVWSGRCWLPGVQGSSQGSIPFVLCAFVWPWLVFVVGVVLALGCGVVGLWWCPACVPCLLAAMVVHGWVARVVGLAPALGIGCWASVCVCGACCGSPPPLWCATLLCSTALCAALCRPCTRVLL